MTNMWTSSADIRSRARRRWDDGTLLRAYAAGDDVPAIEVPLRGPKPSEIGDDLDAVKAWIADLEAGSRGGTHYTLSYASVGGRTIGRNELPQRATIGTYPQAWALLGVQPDVRRYDKILTVTDEEPVVRDWVSQHPLHSLRLEPEWHTIVAAYRWLEAERGSGRYLRQISAPAVDTKFVERNRTLLARLLNAPTGPSTFLDALGLRAKPETIRLRAHPNSGPLGPFSEAVVRLDELTNLDIDVATAVIIENEITYLSVPLPNDGVVIWGKGFEVNRAGSLPWLRDADIAYWGDLDTHGFAILNQLRAWKPQTRSFLMDRETLLTHRDRWVHETTPTAARLDHLTEQEAELYTDLVTDRLDENLRLEQERIDWAWATERLPYR